MLNVTNSYFSYYLIKFSNVLRTEFDPVLLYKIVKTNAYSDNGSIGYRIR